MWWNVRNGLSKFSADPADQLAAAQTTSPLESNALRSAPLEKMIREIGSDLTNIVSQEQENVRTELAHKAREYCMKDISHDLRTPLNAIIGFAQMMENGALGQIENPQYIEYLRHIRESGYELLGQVEGLLDHAPEPSTRSMVSAELEEAVA